MPRALCALAMTHYKKCGTNPAGGQGRPPLRKRYKRCNGRATARVAPTEGYKQYRGRADVGIGPYGRFDKKVPA